MCSDVDVQIVIDKINHELNFQVISTDLKTFLEIYCPLLVVTSEAIRNFSISLPSESTYAKKGEF